MLVTSEDFHLQFKRRCLGKMNFCVLHIFTFKFLVFNSTLWFYGVFEK